MPQNLSPHCAALGSRLGYRAADPVYDSLQHIELRMAEAHSEFARVEVITPRSRDVALAKVGSRRCDYLYHSCFTVKDVNATL